MTGERIMIDPARLASGQWCHRANKTIGQGDISKSYSADRIGMGQPVRKPFEWQGGLGLRRKTLQQRRCFRRGLPACPSADV